MNRQVPAKNLVNEKYSIGDKTYIMQEDGGWKMSASGGKAPFIIIDGGKDAGGPSDAAKESKPPPIYNLIKGQMVNGRKTDLYTVTESSTRETNNGAESSVETDSYWFDQNEFILKTKVFIRL